VRRRSAPLAARSRRRPAAANLYPCELRAAAERRRGAEARPPLTRQARRFAFPALKPPEPFGGAPPRPLAAALGDEVAQAVAAACDRWRGIGPAAGAAGAPAGAAGAAGAGRDGGPGAGPSAEEACDPAAPAWLVVVRRGGGAEARPLAAWEAAQGEGHARVLLACADPGSLPGNAGWPLRNLLLLAAARWRARRVAVVCVRDAAGRACAAASLLVDAALPALPPGWPAAGAPAAAGWEPNARGRPGARAAALGAAMDPARLAAAALDLNLSLMRWRAAPALDTAALAAARCLLLGAGAPLRARLARAPCRHAPARSRRRPPEPAQGSTGRPRQLPARSYG